MKRVILPYAALATAALAYTGYWFAVADRADRFIDAEVADLDARGVAASWDERRIAGYPYRLTAEFTNPALAWSGGGAEWRWQSGSATSHAEPWDLRHYIGFLEGGHVLRRERGGETLEYRIAAEPARTSVELDDSWRPNRIIAELKELSIRPSGGAYAIAAGDTLAAVERADDGVFEFVVRVTGLAVEDADGAPLAPHIDMLLADTALIGPPPTGWSAEALSAWRDGGGEVDLRGLAIESGPIVMRGTGKVSLDSALRPQGVIASRISGFGELVDILFAEGAIGDDAAMALRVAIGLLAAPPEGGGPPEVTAPLFLRDGFLSIGPVPVAELKPLAGLPPQPGG